MVDFISQEQQDNYNELIEQINLEHEKCENLRKLIKLENDKITVKQLANSKLNENISLVTIKVFNDVFEIYSVYENEVSLSDLNKLVQVEGCKFYFFELYITKSLQQKLEEIKWMLSVGVRFDNVCVSQTIEYSNRTPLILVIPINETVVECIVETYLFLLDGDNCLKLKLHTVEVDVSYHFHTFNEKKKAENLNRKILQLNKCYSSYNVDMLRKPLTLEYTFKVNITKEEFSKIFLQHSYHQLDVELFSELCSENKTTFTLSFSTGYNKHTVVYDQNLNIITVKCNVDDLLHLKNYFIKEMGRGTNAPQTLQNELMEFTDKLSMSYSIEKLSENYKQLRNLSRALPL